MSVIKNLIGVLHGLRNPDPSDLLEDWMEILDEDNRRGVLAGTDGEGDPLIPVTYRTGLAYANPKKRKQRAVQHLSKSGLPIASFLPNQAGFKGIDVGGKASGIGMHGNLTTAEYKRLTGPPLAPRGDASRVITNYFQRHGEESEGIDGKRYFAEGAWVDIVSTKGVPFIMAHFDPTACPNPRVLLPRRDLRGLRPWGMDAAKKALRKWIRSVVDQIYFHKQGHAA